MSLCQSFLLPLHPDGRFILYNGHFCPSVYHFSSPLAAKTFPAFSKAMLACAESGHPTDGSCFLGLLIHYSECGRKKGAQGSYLLINNVLWWTLRSKGFTKSSPQLHITDKINLGRKFLKKSGTLIYRQLRWRTWQENFLVVYLQMENILISFCLWISKESFVPPSAGGRRNNISLPATSREKGPCLYGAAYAVVSPHGRKSWHFLPQKHSNPERGMHSETPSYCRIIRTLYDWPLPPTPNTGCG